MNINAHAFLYSMIRSELFAQCHSFHLLFQHKRLIPEAFACSLEYCIGNCATCRGERRFAEARWVDTVVNEMSFNFRDLFHPYQTIVVEVLLLRRAIFERKFSEHRMTESVDDATDYLLTRTTEVYNNTAI